MSIQVKVKETNSDTAQAPFRIVKGKISDYLYLVFKHRGVVSGVVISGDEVGKVFDIDPNSNFYTDFHGEIVIKVD